MDTYEKKYNEAQMRADEAVQKGCLDKAIFDEIFPPEESEDERIRKWLVDYFGSIKNTAWIHRDITCEQILAWLEKQKEPENTSASTMAPSCWEVEQKEQKPNFSEKDSTDFEIEVHEIIAQARNDSRLNDEDVLKQFEEEAAFALMLKANKLIEQQKPAEWSEEDEAMRNNILRVLSCFVGTAECESNPSLSTSYPLYRREIAWLKSLRPQYHGDVTMTEAYKMGLEAGKASSWKPSEEQMEAFRIYLYNPQYIDNSEDIKIKLVESLYNDLKKLM